MAGYVALDRLSDARAIYDQALAKNSDHVNLRALRYGIAFVAAEPAEMARQVAWSSGKPRLEDMFFAFEAGTKAYFGELAN